jgi:pimeloyl-ACP methyl ester carboxylesterase
MSEGRAIGLYREERGSGDPILLIHGNGANTRIWGGSVDDLAATHRVIAYDRRGFGCSPGPLARSMRDHVVDAASLLRSLRSPARSRSCRGRSPSPASPRWAATWRLLPEAQLIELEGTAHAVHFDRPEQFRDAVTAAAGRSDRAQIRSR